MKNENSSFIREEQARFAAAQKAGVRFEPALEDVDSTIGAIISTRTPGVVETVLTQVISFPAKAASTAKDRVTAVVEAVVEPVIRTDERGKYVQIFPVRHGNANGNGKH